MPGKPYRQRIAGLCDDLRGMRCPRGSLHRGAEEDGVVEEAVARLPEGAEEGVVDEVDDAAPAHFVDARYQ